MSNVGKLMFQVGIQEVDTKIADIKRAFDTFDEKYGKGINIKVKLDGAEDLINKLSAIGDPKMLKAYQDEIDKLKKQLSELKDAADKATSGGGSKEGNRVSNLDKLHKAVKDVDSAIESLSSKREAASGLGIDVSQLDAKIAKLKEYREELKRVESTVDLSKSGALRGLTFGGEQLLGSMNRSSYLVTAQNEVKALLAEFEKLIKAKQKLEESSSSSGRPGGSLASHMGEEVKRTSSEVDKLREKYERMMKSLTTSLDHLATNRRTGRGLGLDLPDISKIISQLRALYTTLNEGRMNGSPISTKMIEDTKLMIKVLEQLINTQQRSNATAIAQKHTSDTQQNTHAKQQNAEATRQQTLAEQSLAQALNHTSQSMMSQSSILSDLKSLATQYLGVWGGQQFLHNIIDIGGQLEMQRLSIGAILQNTAQANTLFEQIKGLAVKSPFGVVQLDQMTKQLTAYGFKYNELFDMTKRLADISAATGTDVSRLALALGHVRSEAALSGYTLRQFSMGNVPLLEKLAEKFGKTTAEIRKMVKFKEITYEDVKDVLIGLTDEGGMFYNMQEVISQSVKAKFKNVKDAMDIMYGEMAESSIGDALKGVADVLLKLTTHWRDVLTVVGTGAAVWAANRLAILAYTKTLGASNVAALKTIATQRTQAANNLRIASTYRTLTAAEQSQIATSKRYTLAERTRLLFRMQLTQQQQLRILYARKQVVTDMALALSEKKLTVEAISRQVALGKLTKTQGMMIVKNSTLAASEKALAMQTVYNTKVLGFWGRAWMRTATAMGNFAFTLKSVMTSWQTWFTGVLMAGMEVWQHYTAQMEKAKEIGDSIYERGSEGIKNSIAMFKETDIVVKRKTNGEEATNAFGDDVANAYTFVLPKFDSSDAQASIDAWIQYIQDYAATPNRILQEALYDDSGAVKSLKEQFEGLGQAVVDVASAQNAMKSFSNIFENASMDTFGVFDDDVSKNIKEYDDRLNKLRADATKAYTENRELVESIVNNAIEHDHAFEMATKTMGTYSQKWFELIENLDKYGNAGVSDIISERLGIDTDTGTDYQTMMNDFNTFMENIRTGVEGAGYELEYLSRAHQQALLNSFNEFVDKSGIRSDYLRKLLRKMFSEKFNIPLDIDDVKIPTKLNYIQERLTEVTGQEWKINMEVATNIDDAITEARQKYKSACDYFANVEPILAKFKIDVKLGDALSKEKIENIVSGLPEGVQNSVRDLLVGLNQASTAYNQATSASNNLGFTLTDPTNNSKTFKTPKEKKNSSSGSKEDKELKQWREQLDEINKFYSEYKKYLKEYNTVERALAEMQNKDAFGSYFVNGKSIYDPNDMLSALQGLLGRTKGGTPDREKFINEIRQQMADFQLDQLKEETEKAADDMKEYISKNIDKFNLYKQIKEKLGDSELSMMALEDGKIWDDMSRQFADRLSKMMGDAVIDFDMSEVDAKKFFESDKAAFELWKKIVEMIRNNYTEAIKNAASAQEKLLSSEDAILVKQQKIAELEEEQKQGVDRSAEIKLLNQEIEKLKSEMFEFLPIYEQIFGNKTYKGYGAIKAAENLTRELLNNVAEGAKDPKTGRVSYYTTFYMDDGERKLVTLTRQQLEKLKKTIDDFHKEEVKKDPFSTLIDDIKNLYKTLKEGEATEEEQAESWEKFAETLQEVSKIVGNFAGQLSSMFDALGNESLASALDDVQAGMNSISNIAQGFAKGGVVGGIISAAGEAVGWIGRLANKHDAKLDKAIQKSVREVKKLENAYKNMESTIERRLSGIYAGNEYNEMLANYKKQLTQLESQRRDEIDKKKTDSDKVIDYDQQIKEMRDTIKYFAEDMAKDLYDIDVKSWARDLTDAVVDAWAKGEDAAEAWHDKVIDIVKDVTKNILAQKVVEAALAPVLDIITGEMYNKEGKLDETTIPRIVAAMEAAGEGAVSGLTAILDGLKKEGIDLSDAGKSASSSSSIKSMTEETADLLLSYVNAIRGDVSVNRELQTKIAANIDLLPVMSVTAQAQLQQLTAISQNTLRNADMAEQIYVLFNGLKTGAWRLEVQ